MKGGEGSGGGGGAGDGMTPRQFVTLCIKIKRFMDVKRNFSSSFSHAAPQEEFDTVNLHVLCDF